MEPIYKRVLLKISGEALAGSDHFGISEEMTRKVAKEVKQIHELGVEIAIVVGGGNFWRGRTSKDMDRATADYMGMLATVMNSLALQDAFLALGVPAKVQTAIEMKEVAEHVCKAQSAEPSGTRRHRDLRCGHRQSPFFSTDSGSAGRRRSEADVILLAKNIDGVYDSDPATNPQAVRFDELTHMEVVEKRSQGHGSDRSDSLQGQQHHDPRFRHRRGRQCGQGDRRRKNRNDHQIETRECNHK